MRQEVCIACLQKMLESWGVYPLLITTALNSAYTEADTNHDLAFIGMSILNIVIFIRILCTRTDCVPSALRRLSLRTLMGFSLKKVSMYGLCFRSIALVLSLFLCGAKILPAQDGVNHLTVYPATDGLPQSGDFSIKVRTPGGAWHELPVYLAKVAQGIDTRPPTSPGEPTQKVSMGPQDTSFTSFDFAGTVEVSATYLKGSVERARIRPLSSGLNAEIQGRTLTFSLSKPGKLSLEVNGDIFHNLQIFADPPEESRPDPKDPNVIFYGPGVHDVGRIAIPSGKTIYLAGGALVRGSFLMNHVEHVRILGRGILSQPSAAPRNSPRPQQPANGASTRRDALLVEFSQDVVIDGITVVPNSYTVLVGQSQNVTIRNIKSFSAVGNNDGIDIFDSSDVLVDGVFMRNSDDTIAIYGHRWNYYGDTRHITVQNSVLWADVAHPILVGTHGDSDHPDTLEDLKFLNIDILDQREPQLDYQGCMSLNAGDSNLIRNVRFENIRVEDFREGQLFNLRVFYNKKYNTSPGRGIEDVLFKDISYNGHAANASIVAGYDDTRNVKRITFENLRINGRLITDMMPGKPGFFKTGDMANIFIGEHVDDVIFRPSTPR